MTLTVHGTVKNIRPNQIVILYSEPFGAGNAPSGKFYSALGPCPVTSNGSFSCALEVGAAQNFGDRFYIWAAIVSSAQAYADDRQTTQKTAPSGYPGDPAPTGIGGSHSAGRRLVIRCQQYEACTAT